MNDLYKEYYIHLYKSQLGKYTGSGAQEGEDEIAGKHKKESKNLKLIKAKSAKTESKTKLGSKSKAKNELKIKAR